MPDERQHLFSDYCLQERQSRVNGHFSRSEHITPYIYPISYLGLAIAARKSSILSGLGVFAGWMGSIAWGFIAAAIFVYCDAALLLPSSAASTLTNAIYLHWQIYYIVAAGWVIGHPSGYVLLGAALYRSRSIPRWASLSIVISAPLTGPFAYGLNNGVVEVHCAYSAGEYRPHVA